MASRYRKEREGGSYRDFIPLTNDDFLDVHAGEGRLVTFGSRIGAAPLEREAQKCDINWKTATSWAPLDDSELALDPDDARYNAAVDGHVMEEQQTTSKSTKKSERRQKKKGKGPRSKVSICLRNALMSSGRSAIVASILKSYVDSLVEETFALQLVLTARRESQPSSGLLSTAARTATRRISLARHVVFDAIGPIRSIVFRALPQHIQLLRRRLYPASQLIAKTCATFDVLNLLEKLSLTTKASMYDFYRGLEKLTDNTGLQKPKSRYRALSRIFLQWRHLKLLKWAGRAHDPAGVDGTAPGELALRCPSCPHPGINLPSDWETAPAGTRFLYMMFVCMDANFRLKNQLVSNYSQDPGLGIGWAYMVPRAPYEGYVLSRSNDEDVSSCVGFQALAQANTRFSKGLRYTGVAGAFCGRSEMVLPLAIGNLQKGERYANMDYVFGSAVQGTDLLLILVSYDIACQWFINLFKRMFDHWPEDLRVSEKTKLVPAIPKLHEPMHGAANHQMYSLNYLPGVGASDLEVPERVWSSHNALGNSTKGQGPGSRHDTLDFHISFWNWLKYISLGKTLSRKYRAAVAERNIQVEGHRGLTEGLTEGVPEVWEAICVEWEQDAFPKHKENPHDRSTSKEELAEEEKQRLAAGGVSLHETSAAAFVAMGLDIEGAQRRLQRLAKWTTDKATARQAGGLTEQRNQLTARIRSWEVLLPIYLPGVLQHQADLRAANASLKEAEHPEDQVLWLPSRLPADVRRRICVEGLPRIEERLRTAQCYDALNAIRHVLKIKSRLVKFKNKNVRGQREGTRSRAVIDRVHERARAVAAKYRAGRAAKLRLSGPGDWEKELQVLEDGDIRGYQDPNRLRQRAGRKGTLEDGQIDSSTPAEMETEDFALLPEEPGASTDNDSNDDKNDKNDKKIDEESDDILRSEWAKSRARAARAKEEVLLLREEMRRVLQFLEWKAQWWLGRAELHVEDKSQMEALQGYAHAQAALHRSLAHSFRAAWEKPLGDEDPHTHPSTTPTAHDIPLAGESTRDDEDEEGSEEDEDDSDEEDEEGVERCAESDDDSLEEDEDEDEGEDEEIMEEADDEDLGS
ncbi:hypothetical protein NLJ89_g9327 [Agrocybe chaxingu]|uniref:CxC2-like cysteine cluster KDZ transposase-associated domain-containing protein n=1 Tax=Agrocybe chaxingu TaxID=84603 RepID=A0A9W8JTR8_9AGAR|nr:hypothetical protein NLJ89_g9327 [Agrocybe chaxingu]